MDEIVNNQANTGAQPQNNPDVTKVEPSLGHHCTCPGGCGCSPEIKQQNATEISTPVPTEVASVQASSTVPTAVVSPVLPTPSILAVPAVATASKQAVFQVHVRFRDRCKLFNCFSYDGSIKEDAKCVVDSEDGPQFGQVVKSPKLIPDGKTEGLMKILRIASPDDVKHYYENIQKEKDAYKSCQQKIEEKTLEMKLVEADFSLDRSKIVFYFTSEKRMDFRELVKDLAYLLKARIEMRQIGVRDEAKMLGGYGCCGRELCCVSFLKDFVPVTIKMAKEQHLPLNQAKISGMCGRLMCCLAYEQGQYDSVKQAALSNMNKSKEGTDLKPVAPQIKPPVKPPSSNNQPKPWQNNKNNNQSERNKDRDVSRSNNSNQKSWYHSQQSRKNNNNNVRAPQAATEGVKPASPVIPPVNNTSAKTDIPGDKK